MCIIIYKPVGVKLPSKHILQNCLINNPDGFGYCYPVNNKIHIIKLGLINSAKSILKSIRLNIDNTLDMPIIFHSRIATSGLIDKKACHPYPITDKDDLLRQADIYCNMSCCHNGVLNNGSKVLNDSQLFIKDILSNFTFDDMNKPHIKTLLETYISGSKLAIMNNDSNVLLLGNNWIIENDLYYSNSSYKQENYMNYFKSCKPVKQDYKYDKTYAYKSCDLCGLTGLLNKTSLGDYCNNCLEEHFSYPVIEDYI